MKDTTHKVCPHFLKPCPLISEKLILGCPLFSKRKQKAQRETMIRTILRVKFKDKEYAAHKMVSTGTYPSTRLHTVKEGATAYALGCFAASAARNGVMPSILQATNTKISFSSRSSNVCNFTPRIHQKQSQKVRNQEFSLGGMPPDHPSC